jgi:hypothetical protein
MDQFPLANNNSSDAPGCPTHGIIDQFNTNLHTLFQTNLTDYKTTTNNHIAGVFQPGGLEGVWAQNHQEQVVTPMMQMLSEVTETMQQVNGSLSYYAQQREQIITQACSILSPQLYDEIASEIDLVGPTVVLGIVGTIIEPGLGTLVLGGAGLLLGGALDWFDSTVTGDHIGGWVVDRIFGGDYGGDGERGVQEWVRELLSGTGTFDVRYQLASLLPNFETDSRFNHVRDQLNGLEQAVMSDLDYSQSLLTTQAQKWDQLAQFVQHSVGPVTSTTPTTTTA